MTYKLPDLPYSADALRPYVSAETLEFHHGKHHRGYVDQLNKEIQGTPFTKMGLEDIIRESSGAVFNNAAQHFNHSFYWKSLSPEKPEPGDKLLKMIDRDFGSFGDLRELFVTKAAEIFGSGWCWLILQENSTLAVEQSKDAENPLTTEGKKPLIACDVWEHAYYLDYQNDRKKYLGEFWKIVNWDFAEKNLTKPTEKVLGPV